MKPKILLLVQSRDGSAQALASVGCQRARDLGLSVEVVENNAMANKGAEESVTAVVPVDFAAAHHEAWCLLCQLSLLRCEVSFSILVLGVESGPHFEARQRALLQSPSARSRRRQNREVA